MAGKNTAKSDFQDSARTNREAEQVAARLPELELIARQLASQIYGLRRRSKPGPGTDYHSHVPFNHEIHDPRKIDHKASARRQDRDGEDLHMIRQREMEVSQKFYLWRDGSKSMDYKAPKDLFPEQPPYTKKEAAEILLLTTAYLSVAAGENFALLGGTGGLSNNKKVMPRILKELEHSAAQDDADLPKLFMHKGRPLEKGSQVFIFSDFLCPVEEIAAMIKSLQGAGVRGHLVQVLDPSEVEFRYKGHVKFESPESGATHTIKKSESVKAEMEERIKNHIRDIRELVKRAPNWTFSTYVTDRPLHDALLPLYGIQNSRTAGNPGPRPR
ncbi:MAG: hypothetical protein H6867_00755 [Rhodospirillales bacterium]|nr:hypothetical protein [Rhodospirillales bacterium]MCB9996811.1 hypothetical protein [Rhodospirillales bacterium]